MTSLSAIVFLVAALTCLYTEAKSEAGGLLADDRMQSQRGKKNLIITLNFR